MFPPVFAIAVADSSVTALLGANPTRFFLFGEAVQNTQKPYAVWQVVSGEPYNTLSCPPDVDRVTVQIDAYGNTVSSVRSVAAALRGAFEASGGCYVVSLNGEQKESDTNLFRSSFDLEFHVKR